VSNWADDEFACFDLETTGLVYATTRIVTSCVAVIPAATHDPDGRRLPRPPDVSSLLADPGIEIPKEASDVHGITTEYAREHGMDAATVVDEVTASLAGLLGMGVPVVGANLQYDLTILHRECRRYGYATLDERLCGRLMPIIDVMVIDRALDRYRSGGRKLEDLARHYGVKFDGAHNSTEDALAAGRIAWMQATAGPNENGLDVGAMRPAELHAAQVKWKAAQAANFAAYLRREASKSQDPEMAADLRARADDVRGEWPFVPANAEALF
jgi:DNA polymerase-3 subunit epsilon